MAFTSNSGGGPMADINVTPLVDVMLVLLIIFMITAPVLSLKIKVDLPQPNQNMSSIRPNPKDPIHLKIDQSGAFYWNDTPVDELGLKAQLAVIAQQSNQPLKSRSRQTTQRPISMWHACWQMRRATT
jgi:biopolymer transport protein ExbD